MYINFFLPVVLVRFWFPNYNFGSCTCGMPQLYCTKFLSQPCFDFSGSQVSFWILTDLQISEIFKSYSRTYSLRTDCPERDVTREPWEVSYHFAKEPFVSICVTPTQGGILLFRETLSGCCPSSEGAGRAGAHSRNVSDMRRHCRLFRALEGGWAVVLNCGCWWLWKVFFVQGTLSRF